MAPSTFVEASRANASRWANLAAASRATNSTALAKTLMYSDNPVSFQGGSASKPTIDPESNSESPFGRLMDLLTAPLAGVAGAIGGVAEGVRNAQSNEGFNPLLALSGAAKGVAGNLYSTATGDPNIAGKQSFDKVSQDFLDSEGAKAVGLQANQLDQFRANYNPVEKSAGFKAADLVASVAGDPLTYVGLPEGLLTKLGLRSALDSVHVGEDVAQSANKIPAGQPGADVSRSMAEGYNQGFEKSGQSTLFSKNTPELQGDAPLGQAERLGERSDPLGRKFIGGPDVPQGELFQNNPIAKAGIGPNLNALPRTGKLNSPESLAAAQEEMARLKEPIAPLSEPPVPPTPKPDKFAEAAAEVARLKEPIQPPTPKPSPPPVPKQVALAQDVADALAPVMEKVGVTADKITAVRNAAAIRALNTVPMFKDIVEAAPAEAATPVATASTEASKKALGSYIEDVIKNKIGSPTTKADDLIPVEVKPGKIQNISAKTIGNAIYHNRVPAGFNNAKFSLADGETVTFNDLVSRAPRATKPSRVNPAAQPVSRRTVTEAWREAAQAAGLSKTEINKILTSKDAEKTINSIADAAHAKEQALAKSAADSGMDPTIAKAANDGADYATQQVTAEDLLDSGDAAKIAEGQPIVAAQAVKDLATESERMVRDTYNAAVEQAEIIKKHPRSKPTPEEAKRQREATGVQHSVVNVKGVIRNNPNQQKQLLSRLAGKPSVWKFAVPKKNMPLTMGDHLNRAQRLYKMLQAAEEQIKLLGHPPMTFVDNSSFRLSEFLAAVAKDIGTTPEDLLVRLGYTRKAIDTEDRALADTINRALTYSSRAGKGDGNKGLKDMALSFKSVQHYLKTSQAVQATIDATVIPKAGAEVADLLSLTDAVEHTVVPTDAKLLETAASTVPSVAHDVVSHMGGSQSALDHVIANTNEHIIEQADNETAMAQGSANKTLHEKSDGGDKTVDNQAGIMDAANKDLGVGPNIMDKVEATEPRWKYRMMASAGMRKSYSTVMEHTDAVSSLTNLAKHDYQGFITEHNLTEPLKTAWNLFNGTKTGALTQQEQEIAHFVEWRMGKSLKDSEVAAVYNIGQNSADRAGLTMDDINKMLKQNNVDFLFSGKEGEWRDSWRKYEGKLDPVELSFQIEAAIGKAAHYKMLWADLHTLFGRVPNGVKVKGIPELANSTFDPVVAKEMPFIFNRLNQAMNPSSEFGRGIDTFLASWKPGVTIYSPSHHVRNVIGDLFFAWIAGVPIGNPRLIKMTKEIMMAKKEFYSDFMPENSNVSAMTELLKGNFGVRKATDALNYPVDPTKVVLTLTGKGGSKVPITADTAYTLAYEAGIVKPSHIIEDIPNGSLVEKAIEKYPASKRILAPTGGRASKFARGVSETREHSVRIMHFMDKFEKSFNKNIARGMNNESAIKVAQNQAAEQVKKWHPDGSGMTDFERSYMRRFFPFYSWTRKAIPLLAEGMLASPGKMVMYPKVMHGLAEINGVNQQDVANPWPVDQMFPSWLRELPIGPMSGDAQSGYTVINPSNPFTDLGNQFLNSPLQGAAGMINPLFRVPAEVLARRDITTGADIKDWSQYIDKQIPPLATVNRLGNTDLGAGNIGNSGLPLNKVGQNEGPINGFNLINWLTAAGLIDASKQNYQKQAQYEQRDRKAEEARVRKAALLGNG